MPQVTAVVLLLCISSVVARLPCGGYENIYVCKEDDPSTFLICTYGYEYEFQCPPGLHFNAKVSICDWPGKASCELDEEDLEAENMPMYEDDDDDYMSWQMPTTNAWWPRRTTTMAPWWTRPTTTTTQWWPRPKKTTQSWFQHQWKPKKITPRPTPRATMKPRHGQLTDNGWRNKKTTRYDPRLIRGPSDPWAPITTAVEPTKPAWQERSTPRTAQVAWKERKAEEQNGIEVKETTPKPTKIVDQENDTETKVKCPKDTCKLPDCRCPGSDIPGGLHVKKVPQMIMLTFDDKVNEENLKIFQKLFTKERTNPNGCPIKATFFVSKVGTDFQKVKELYDGGHEIASHSKSYRFPHSWWASATYEDFKDEIEGMREELVSKSNIPYGEIKGMRVPFLQIGGDNQFKVLQDFNYMYDSSMVTGHLLRDKRPPIWPFTLDYPVDCKYSSVEPRPKKPYPGLWEVPVARLYGNDGRACSMADSCVPTKTAKMALKYLRDNFLRHYTKNRAPIGIFVHATWFKRESHAMDAMQEFIEKLTQLSDVWFLTVSQVIEWTKNPTPIADLKNFEPFNCKKST